MQSEIFRFLINGNDMSTSAMANFCITVLISPRSQQGASATPAVIPHKHESETNH